MSIATNNDLGASMIAALNATTLLTGRSITRHQCFSSIIGHAVVAR